MSSWGAAATLLTFPAPIESGPTIAAFGNEGVFSETVFNELWSGFTDTTSLASRCAYVRNLTDSDETLIAQDSFLAVTRGIDKVLCKSDSWFVSGLRIDPCRVRSVRANLTMETIRECSQSGKFSEVRIVLQPIGRHDRGVFFPDAAIHMSFSSADMSDTASKWKRVFLAKKREGLSFSAADIKSILDGLKEHDASVMFSDAGLSRWTFARAEYRSGQWKKVPLAHGGLHESLSDAGTLRKFVRTKVKQSQPKAGTREILNPLVTHPLNGSCVECHLADARQPARAFRQLGWGLSGEKVVSRRTAEEAIFSANELNVLDARQDNR
jgi:hypothetical protein